MVLRYMLLAAVVPLTAQAEQPKVRVVVVTVQPPATSELAALVWSARDAVSEMDALVSADIAGALSSGGEDPVDADGARGLLETGRKAFEDLALDRAATQVRRAGALLVAAGAATDAAGAFSLLAQVQRARKDADGVREAFSLLLHVAPDHEIEPGSVPPSVQRAFDEARTEQETAKQVALRASLDGE